MDTQPPELNQPLPPSQSNRTPVFLTIAISGLVFLILGFSLGQHFSVKKQSITAPTPTHTSAISVATPTSDQTTGWETYVFKNYPLILKYPSTLILKENAVDSNYPLEITDGKAVLGINPKQLGMSLENPDLEITSMPINNDQNQPLALFGQTVTKTKIYEKSTQKTSFLVVITYPDKRDYSILVDYEFANGKVDENIDKTFDQILSTFEFITEPTIASSKPFPMSDFLAPFNWQRYATDTGLYLCLPPKWESNQYGQLVYNRDPGYKPSIGSLEPIPYSGGSKREAYFKFWENEVPDVRNLVSVTEKVINNNSVLTIQPVNSAEPKTSPEGLAVVWYSNGKLWKASLSNWSQINSSQPSFLKDFYTMISCSF